SAGPPKACWAAPVGSGLARPDRMEGGMLVDDLTDPRRTEPAYVADEPTMLEAWLEFHRMTLLLKGEGVDRAGLVARPVATSLLSRYGSKPPRSCPTRAWWCCRLCRPRRPGSLGQGRHQGRAGGGGPGRAEAGVPPPRGGSRDTEPPAPGPSPPRRWTSPACRGGSRPCCWWPGAVS